MAGFATGAFIGMLLQLWMIVIGEHEMPGPTAGEALLAGMGFGLVAAAVVSLLAALHGRLRLWSLFLPMLLVALITGMISALLARVITPALVMALLAMMIGYLLGLFLCLLCRHFNLGLMAVRR